MTDVHPAAARGFGAGAAVYAAARPDYPPGLATWLRAEIGLAAGSVVVDLGAGTGKFVPLLRGTGASVIAVEPVAAMRERLSADQPGSDVRAGTAEHLPLPDAAADAVICAQAFHWFATGAALAGIRRVLKPGGVLGLVWNVRDERVPWVAALTALLARYEGDAPRYHTGAWRRLFPAPGFGRLAAAEFRHGHTGPPERVIVDRLLSVSFIAALPAEEQRRFAAGVRAVLAATPELATKDEVTFPYVTAAYWCVKDAG